MVGGSLLMDSKGTIDIKGSEVNVDGNATIKSIGKITITAAQDTYNYESKSTSKNSFSTSNKTTEEYSLTNVGSKINVGGFFTALSKDDINIAGSKFEGKGGLYAEAGLYIDEDGKEERSTERKNVNIYALKDIKQTTTTEKKSGFSPSLSADSFTLNQSRQVDTFNYDETARGSLVSSEKSFGMKASGNINLVGSGINSKEDPMLVAGGRVNIMSAEEKHISIERVMETRNDTGTFLLSVGAGALGGLVTGNPFAGAGAGAINGLEAQDKETKTTTTIGTTHSASTIDANNLNIIAGDKVSLIGPRINLTGNMNITAKSYEIGSDYDTQTTETKTEIRKPDLEKLMIKSAIDGAMAGFASQTNFGSEWNNQIIEKTFGLVNPLGEIVMKQPHSYVVNGIYGDMNHTHTTTENIRTTTTKEIKPQINVGGKTNINLTK